MGPRPAAIFVGDAPGLDFLNSVATPVDIPVDWIADGEGLLSWLEQARLVPDEALQAIRAKALPDELDRVADQARRLREWFREFVLRHKGSRLALRDARELEPLNRLLRHDERFSQIVQRPDTGSASASLEIEEMRPWRSSESLLLPIAVALAELIVTENFAKVRACEGPACTLLFVDHTRGRARRWCSMAICGNRAKQAAHRQRVKERQQQGSSSGEVE